MYGNLARINGSEGALPLSYGDYLKSKPQNFVEFIYDCLTQVVGCRNIHARDWKLQKRSPLTGVEPVSAIKDQCYPSH